MSVSVWLLGLLMLEYSMNLINVMMIFIMLMFRSVSMRKVVVVRSVVVILFR